MRKSHLWLRRNHGRHTTRLCNSVGTSSFFAFVLLILAAAPLRAAEYYCAALKKYDFDRVYTPEYLKKARFSTRLEELPEGSFLSRCSFSTVKGKVTCDRYKVDRVEFDRNVGIKKYYVFRSQFDFQLFSNLSSLENNGRGSVQYGKCALIVP